jgi:hypothetical protein
MRQCSGSSRARKWHDSAHASLCLLGSYLRRIDFFRPLEEAVKIRQKVLKYTPVQKVEMLFVSLLAGAKAVYQTGTTLRVDRALQGAFGLPGCAEQSVIADTLDAANEQDVADLRGAVEQIFLTHSRARQHDFAREVLVLDIDLSPLPASASSEGSERGYMGRNRSKTGRKLVRVSAAQYQEIVWQGVWSGRAVESLAVLQQAVQAAERLLGLEGEDAVRTAATRAKRARTEFRLDSGWGSEAGINWLKGRGYQVTGKFKSWSRVAKLVKSTQEWLPSSSPGREVAVVLQPVELVRATQQYAVRTPSTEKKEGYQHAVLFSSRLELEMQEVVTHYDERAGMEAELKGDKHGLGLATLRKHKLAAQEIVVLLVELAHNVLIWSKAWLARGTSRLGGFGVVRLVQEVWAVPGRVKLDDDGLRRVRLNPAHPLAGEVAKGLGHLLAESQTLGFWG